MIRAIALTCGVLAFVPPAIAQESTHGKLDGMIQAQAQANGVPVSLVHRVIRRESGYRPGLVGRGGAIGLMQIKLATARGLGYTGTARGLLDPETNLTYAVRYLAGAYHVANGNSDRAVMHYARGYYYAAKRKGMLGVLAARRHSDPGVALASAKAASTAAMSAPEAKPSAPAMRGIVIRESNEFPY
jgi:soluble lytic murein transglycosylase-like protein